MTLTDDTVEFDREEYLSGLGELVMSGGLPYILLVVENPETGTVALTHQGVDPAVVPAALRDIADQIEAAAAA